MRKLLNLPSFFIGFSIIFFFSIVAIPGYLIAPDDTTDCNDIVPQFANQPPGSVLKFIRIKNNNTDQENTIVSIWLHGRTNAGNPIPFATVISESKDSIVIQELNSISNSIYSKNNLQLNRKSTFIFSRKFYLGSDRFGRDVLSRLMIGARVSLFVGFVSVIISLILGVFIGLVAGYSKGKIDSILSWFIAVFWSIPTLLIALGLSFAFGKGLLQVLVAIGLSTWVEVARVVRGQTMQLREKEFILAARITGFSMGRILFRHILPNLKGSLTVLATTNFAAAILLEAGLSFLGLGISPPAPSWGIMVNEYRGNLVLDTAYLALIPGAAIMLLVMGFNLLSMGLRDALDTHLPTAN